MHKYRVIALMVLLASAAGCHSTAPRAISFHSWGKEDAAEAKADWERYKHILLVCVYEDSWDDPPPRTYTSYRMKGTVVRVYKGDWLVSETISFVHGLDYRMPAGAKATAGRLMFLFTNEHTDKEIGVGTGQFPAYDGELERALLSVYPEQTSR